MLLVVDSNIIFSAILNPKSKIGQIIINGSKYFSFISVEQLKFEIKNHEEKILKISELNHSDFLKIYEFIESKIKFVHYLLINDDNYKEAEELTHDIDPDDLLFVGLSLQFRCKLWSGDKKLIKGLQKKEFDPTITTEELFQIYLNNEFDKRYKKEK